MRNCKFPKNSRFLKWLNGKNLPANAGYARDRGSILGLGRSLGIGNGNLFQQSLLENSMDRRPWWATVLRGVTESDMIE